MAPDGPALSGGQRRKSGRRRFAWFYAPLPARNAASTGGADMPGIGGPCGLPLTETEA